MRICIAFLLLALCSPCGWSAENANRPPRWSVYFSPHGGCTEAVVEALGKARSTVLVQAYSFTSAPIAKALVEAHRRGVKVEVPGVDALQFRIGLGEGVKLAPALRGL